VENDAEGAVDRKTLVLKDQEKLAAVICISEFGECPAVGVRSVISNAAYFKELHLVQHGYSTQRKLYPAWFDDLKELTKLGLVPVWHSRFDANKVYAGAVVYIAPDMQVADGAVAMLHEEMMYCAKNDPAKTHFSITSITSVRLSDAEKRDPLQWLHSASYGFLLVIMMLDWLRWAFNLGKYHKTFDLRAECLFTTFPQRVQCAPERWSWWIRNTGQTRTKSGGAALLHIPKGADTGIPFLLRSIKLHNHLSYGWWVFGFALYYFLFAWPWWNVLFTKAGWAILYPLTRDPWAWYWQLIYVLHTLVVAIVAWMCMELPLAMLPVQVIVYTGYLTLSPLVLLYGRFHMSRASWKHFGWSSKKRRNGK